MINADAEVPAAFTRALAELRAARLRPEIVLTEIPAPTRIAPYAVAVTGEISERHHEPSAEGDPAAGRFVLLHDPDGQEAWEGTFRVVTLVRAALDPELGTDPVLAEAAWTWVTDALRDTGAQHHALGGTVTRVDSRSFGGLQGRPAETEVEIRATWSPDGDLGKHFLAWSAVLCAAEGLPPLPDGVTPLGRSH